MITSTLKLLFLDFTNHVGGAELSLVTIVSHTKFSSHVLTTNAKPFLDLLDAEEIQYSILEHDKILRGLKKQMTPFMMIKSFASLWRVSKGIYTTCRAYDVVYSNTYKSHFFAAINNICTRKPTVLHIRDMLERNIFDYILKILINASTCRIIVNSKATQHSLLRARISKKVTVVYNGFPKVKPAPPPVWPSNRKIKIGVFSRLSRSKGILLAIQIVSDLISEGLPIHCNIVGGEVNGESDYLNELKCKIKTQRLSEQVTLVGYSASPLKLMREVDILLVPSTYAEPFGRVAVEGMLAGRIVIASRVGGLCEIIEHGIDGFLFDPNKPDEAKELVWQLYMGAYDTKMIHERATRKCRQLFSISQMSSGIEGVLIGAMYERGK